MVRGLLRARHSKANHNPMRHWQVRPCIEALELRTLPSAAWTAPAPPPPVVATLPPSNIAEPYVATPNAAQLAAGWGNLQSITSVEPDVILVAGGGLDRLLQDLGQRVTQVQERLDGGEFTTPTLLSTSPQPAPGHIAVDPGSDGGHVFNPGPISTPGGSAATTAAQAVANAPGIVITAFSEVASRAGQQAATALLTPPNLPSADPVAELWRQEDLQPRRDTGKPPPNPEVQTAFADPQVWDDAAILSQVPPPPQTPTNAVWNTPSVAPAGIAQPLETTDTFTVHAGVNSLALAVPDGALLERFVSQRDQTAFTALVARYERMVFSVCNRVLGDTQAAEDAAQATFLVLASKASVLDAQRPLMGWLHLVAYHLALRLRVVAARRRRSELRAARGRPTQQEDESAAHLESQEVYQVLHEELHRLPDHHRVPLILCYFQGRTHAEAADTIGMPRGSIAKRIGEGLQRLRERLIDRGIAS
jgi:RNA polymerase sigma factor (sigma-70 family)